MTSPKSFDARQPKAAAPAEPGTRAHILRDAQGLVPTLPPAERALLVGVELHDMPAPLPLEDSLDELTLLAKTADLAVVGRLTQRLTAPNPATLIGSGKLDELQLLATELAADVVIFDDELSPRQQRELEKALGENVKVIDRTALILDIFASHARTREGALQVELAQYEYRLPRLTRAWTHLARQSGGRAGGASGGVGVRGPGETQLEVDRREINRRIAFLKRELEDVRKHRDQYRAARRAAATPVVAVVGYTNAGKSTLLNTIAQADVLAEDKLFATLDPTTRRVVLPSDRVVLFSDTVGFIQKLPTQLIAAFRSTLEEVVEADLLLHVVDLSHLNMEEQIIAVEEVLEELGAGSKPVVMALNKVDRFDLDDPADARLVAAAQADYPGAVVISAEQSWGIDVLLDAIDAQLRHHMAPVDVLIPYSRGELVSYIHEHGIVEHEEHTGDGTHVVGRLPVEMAGRFAPFWYQEAAT